MTVLSTHLAQASAAFDSSGHGEAACLVVDRAGETGAHFRAGKSPEIVFDTFSVTRHIAKDGRIWLPDDLSGIGELYQVITLALGFDDPGKTMDLAPYGRPLSMDTLLLDVDDGLSFERATESLLELGLVTRVGNRLLLATRSAQQPLEQFHHDLAAQIQYEFEQAVLYLAREVLAHTASRSLVLAGECFRNAMVNTRIRNETEIDSLYIAVGTSASSTSPEYSRQDVEALASEWRLPARAHKDVAKVAAAAIARGEIVGWFQEKSEAPRASVLCHPAIEGMRVRLNARVKGRESFRPYAGSVLAEQAGQWFAMPDPDSPFMLYSCPVLPHRRDMVSELVHVDGTCRVQTVDEDDPVRLRRLIESFEDQTGLPMVLNTAFSLPDRPQVELAEDALDCLYSSRLDRLFIGDLEIDAPAFAALRPVPVDPAIRQTAICALSSAAPTALDGFDQVSLRILELADGARSMRDIAAEIDVDVDKAIDLAIDMKRQRMLHWAAVPSR